MAIIGKTSASFKIFEAPEDERHENRLTLSKEYQIQSVCSEQSFSDLGTENRTTRMKRCARRGNPEESLEPATSTKTPETFKVSPVVPNAPVKPPRAAKKLDMQPKRLQFVEEAEDPCSMDSGIETNATSHRYPTRINRNVMNAEHNRPSSSKGKDLQSARSKGRKNWPPDGDKENCGSLGNSRHNVLASRVSSKKTLTQKNSSKQLPTTQNRLKPEGDLAHFRI